MVLNCDSSNLGSILMERYPDMGFALHYTAFESFDLFCDKEGKYNALRNGVYLHSNEGISKEIASFKSSLDLAGIEVLYLYGIGLGYHYLALKEWLHEKKERAVIFFEDDLAVIDALMKMEHAKTLLLDPQVHLHFIDHPKRWESLIEECVQNLPSERIEMRPIAAYANKNKAKMDKLRLKLLRDSATSHALLYDHIYCHFLLDNLLKNFKRFPSAFFIEHLKDKFANIPAIICGAGPSLALAAPLLKTLEQKALIMAGGSAVAALGARGICPHLSVALDPNPEEYLRFKPISAFEVPLIYGNRVLPDIFSTCNGPPGYLRTGTGGSCELWFEDKLNITGELIGYNMGPEAFSVTTLELALAYFLGCNPIILVGVDLAYTGMQRYASGVMADSSVFVEEMKKDKRACERLLQRKDRHGKRVHTLLKWVMESSVISDFAKNHPDRLFINSTDGGIGFKDIDYLSLDTAIEKHCSKSYDLKGMVHAEIAQSSLNIPSSKIEKICKDLFSSLKRCSGIVDEILQELHKIKDKIANPDQLLDSGKLMYLEFNFQEEMAYECLLQSIGPALDRLLSRVYHLSNDTYSLQYREEYIEKKIAKWSRFKQSIEAQLNAEGWK